MKNNILVPSFFVDYELTPNEQIFSAMPWREQVTFRWNDDDVRIELDQHAGLEFNSASYLKQQSTDRHGASIGHIILTPSQQIDMALRLDTLL